MMRCLFLLVVAASSAVASAQQKLTKVAAIQMSMSTSLEANVDKALNLVAEAADGGAKIIVLPELFAARYFAIEENPKWYAIAEPLANNSRLDKFAALAKDRGVVVIYPFYEVAANGATHYDSAAVIDADGTVLGGYRKSQLPEDDGWFEKYYFAPGQTGFEVWDTIHGKVGVAICWDQWFPETHRLLTLAGAEVAVFPTAIGFGPVARWYDPWQLGSWVAAQQGQSVANGLPLVVANRVGLEPSPDREDRTISFWGNAFVTSAAGEIVARGDNASETVVSAVVDLGPNVNRDIWLRDRRVDLYGGLLESDLRATARQFPAEWEPHEAVWLGFPPFLYTNASGPTNRDASAAVCCALADHGVKVRVATADAAETAAARRLLRGACAKHAASTDASAAIELVEGIPHDDAWWRDMGPQFLDGGAVLDTAFDGWGYAVAQPADAYFCSSAATEDNVDRLTALALGRETKVATDVVVEGGNVEVFRGSGKDSLLLSVEAVQVQRNPSLNASQIAARMARAYGYPELLWLAEGNVDDEFPWRGPVDVHGEAVYTYGTGGHVDEVARFAPDGRVLLGVANADVRGPLYDEARRRDAANRKTLAARGLEVVEIEQPEFLVAKVAPGDGYLYDTLKGIDYGACDASEKWTRCQAFPDGDDVKVLVAASYLNYLVTNGLVLMQKYCVPGRCASGAAAADAAAKKALEAVFADRTVVALDMYPVNLGGGGVHCYTHQQPAL